MLPKMVQNKEAYLGRNRRRLYISFGMIIIISIIAAAFAAMVQPISPGIMSWLDPLVVWILVVGGGLAALNAYWNNGIVASWALAGSFSGSIFWPEPWIMVIGFLGGVVIGTYGYALGRILLVLVVDIQWNAPSNLLLRRLLGVDPRQTMKWGMIAGGLLLAAHGLVTVSLPHVSQGQIQFFLIAGIAAVTATVAVYQNGGLLLAWILVFAPIFGTSQLPVDTLTQTFLIALTIAVILGSVCYTLGTNLRRFFPPQFRSHSIAGR